jgi:hypothetical protein
MPTYRMRVDKLQRLKVHARSTFWAALLVLPCLGARAQSRPEVSEVSGHSGAAATAGEQPFYPFASGEPGAGDGQLGAVARPALANAAVNAAAFDIAAADVDSILAAFQQPATQQPATPQPSSQPAQDAGSKSQLPEAPKPAGQSSQNNVSNDSKDTERKKDCLLGPCPTSPIINWYMRFENGPQVKPMTPMEKGWLATRNVIDPFNIVTILGISAISVAADSHSAYGPGFPGWGRYVGVSFTEDITGEFFGTFLICSLAHQDPHYHRMPQASYKKRIFHAIYQIAWTQGDNGKGMVNYSDLVGAGIDDEIANLYVPGRRTNASSTAQRYGIALATAPIDNFITEFLPDVARRIHIQVVVVQRIIDQVASDRSTNGGS